MSESPKDPLPELPPGIASLFAREARSEIVVDPARKTAALARVSRAVDFALPPAPEPSGSVLAPKVMAIAAMAFLAGGVVGALIIDRTSERAAPRQAPIAVVGVTASAAPSAAPSNELPSVAVSDLPSSSAAPTPHPSADKTGGLARERETIDAARAALVHGDQAEAMRKVHEHETRWPHGALEEEREAVAIQALATSGQRTAAEERAARFRRRFPGSMLSGVIDAALAR